MVPPVSADTIPADKRLRRLSLLLISTPSVYLIIVALRLVQADGYPPPGTRVIRATRLRTGLF